MVFIGVIVPVIIPRATNDPLAFVVLVTILVIGSIVKHFRNRKK